jgi:hypothetical protein
MSRPPARLHGGEDPGRTWSTDHPSPRAAGVTLPRSAWPGDCPALLRDYHDDLVAEPVLLPMPQRTIVIHAMELPMIN